MGNSIKVNEQSCYFSLIVSKIHNLDADLKKCYNDYRKTNTFTADIIKKHILYFRKEKVFWIDELKKCLNLLEYKEEDAAELKDGN